MITTSVNTQPPDEIHNSLDYLDFPTGSICFRGSRSSNRSSEVAFLPRSSSPSNKLFSFHVNSSSPHYTPMSEEMISSILRSSSLGNEILPSFLPRSSSPHNKKRCSSGSSGSIFDRTTLQRSVTMDTIPDFRLPAERIQTYSSEDDPQMDSMLQFQYNLLGHLQPDRYR